MAGRKDTPADRLLREGPIEDPGGVLPPQPDAIVAASRPIVKAAPRPGRRQKDLPMDDIAASYKAGMSESELARVHGVARGTIARRLSSSGVKRQLPPADKVLPGRRYSRRPAMVASASRVNLSDRTSVKSNRSRRQAWQSEAFDYSDETPEVNFAVNFMANLMAKVRLFPAIKIDPQSPPVPIDSPEAIAIVGAEASTMAIEILGRLRALQGGQAAILHDMSINFDISGELYLHGHTETPDEDWDDPDSGADDGSDYVGDEDWQVRSIDELVVTGDSFALRVGTSSQSTQPIPETDLCIRLWNRHPRYSFLATSPMRPILGTCETLLLLEREQRAHAMSHLNAGAFIVAQEVSFGAIDPTRDQSDGEESDDPLNEEINSWFINPVQEPGSAQSVAPGLLRPPAEYCSPNFIRWIDMARPDNQYLDQRIENLVMRIARGLNVPVEVVTGLMQTTFSNASQVKRNINSDHLEPRCILVCDCVTAGFLQWQLIEAGIDKEIARQIFTWFDMSAAMTEEDQAEAAMSANKQLLVSDAATRRLLGYTEDDAPTTDEMLLRIVLNSPRLDPFILAQILRKSGLFPDLRVAAPPVGVLDEHESVSEMPTPATPVESDGSAVPPPPLKPPPPPEPSEPPVEPTIAAPADKPAPVTASAASAAAKWKALGPRLAAVDRDLRTRTLGALDRAMAVALKAAGNRVKSKVQARSTEAKLIASAGDPALYPSTLGRTIVTAAGLSTDALVGDGFDSALLDVRGWIDSAYTRALDLIGTVATIPAAKRTELDVAHKANTDHAVDFLKTQLVGLASKRLYDPTPTADMRGEHDPNARVPVGIVRAALAVAGGTTPQLRALTAGSESNERDTGVWFDVGGLTDQAGGPVFGVATGPDIMGALADTGASTEGYVWVYGNSARSFQPHADLDGVTAADFDDPAWANPDGWPSDQCLPGDHDGCLCDCNPVLIGPDGATSVDLG